MAQSHTYFVREPGTSAEPVWVHDTCEDSAELGRNLLAEGEAKNLGEDAAHIVPTGEFSRLGPKTQSYVKYAQDVLKDVDIDLNDAVNGFFTHDTRHLGTHTPQYFRGLAQELGQVRGHKEKVLAVLESIKDSLTGVVK